MTTWNQGPYPPPDPNQYYGGGQGQPYPGQQFPPPNQPGMGFGAPPPGMGMPPGGFPPQGMGMGGAPPMMGAGGYPPQPGFMPPPSAGYGAQPDMYGTNYSDMGDVKGFDFNDQAIRRGFLRKVYSILMMQLLITLGFIVWFVYHEPTRQYVQHNFGLFIAAFVVLIVTMIALSCCGDLRRKSPANMILLLVFTIAESFFLATTASYYRSEEVVMAVGITAAVCFGLTLFAFQTKWDFTVMGGILFVAVIILLIFGIVAIFVHSKIVTLIYGCLGALIFSVYLVYDTQLMMGGKHKYSISPEEYIFASLNLYIDIINIFMYILTIIGASRD